MGNTSADVHVTMVRASQENGSRKRQFGLDEMPGYCSGFEPQLLPGGMTSCTYALRLISAIRLESLQLLYPRV